MITITVSSEHHSPSLVDFASTMCQHYSNLNYPVRLIVVGKESQQKIGYCESWPSGDKSLAKVLVKVEI